MKIKPLRATFPSEVVVSETLLSDEESGGIGMGVRLLLISVRCMEWGILDEGNWQNHGDSFLRFSEKERREKWMFLSFERLHDVADGSQYHHLWSKRRSEIGNEGAKQHQWAREVTQIARWFDADCRVKWRKSQDEVTQIGNAFGVNESCFLVNTSHTTSYKNRSFSLFFRPADILFSNTRVLPHLNSKFSWQSYQDAKPINGWGCDSVEPRPGALGRAPWTQKILNRSWGFCA